MARRDSVVLILLALVILSGTISLFGQVNDDHLTASEWSTIKTRFWKSYNNKSPAKRKEAINELSNKYINIYKAEPKIKVGAAEIFIQVLGTEEVQDVAESAGQSLRNYLQYPEVLNWITDNYKKLITKEFAKLNFVEVFSDSSKPQPAVKNILLDLLAKTEAASVRVAALKCLMRHFLTEVKDEVMNAARDENAEVCKEAVPLFVKVIKWPQVPELMKLLAEEKRKEIKEVIGDTLEKITLEKFGTDAAAWWRWWDKRPAGPTVRKADVDAAVKKGVDFLLKSHKSGGFKSREEELVFYTMIKSGQLIPDNYMKSVLREMTLKKLTATYNVALLAMALGEIDRRAHFARIVQCAEFLLGNMTKDGSWSYGKEVTKYVNTNVPLPPEIIKTGGGSTRSVKPMKVKIKAPPRLGDDGFDNSNTQYALLGLRACTDAGIEFPAEVWADAEKHLLATQCDDGGWGYRAKSSSGYGSMSAGGLGSLIIAKFYQDKPIQKDRNVDRAYDWLSKNFSVTENPKGGFAGTLYYYLYSLERAGIILDTTLFGTHDWYNEGATFLLAKQSADGS